MVRSTASPALTDPTSPATEATAGKQVRKARIPFARAFNSRATRICSAAPNRSEHGAIRIRVSAFMIMMLFCKRVTGCDRTHRQGCGITMRDTVVTWITFISDQSFPLTQLRLAWAWQTLYIYVSAGSARCQHIALYLAPLPVVFQRTRFEAIRCLKPLPLQWPVPPLA